MGVPRIPPGMHGGARVSAPPCDSLWTRSPRAGARGDKVGPRGLWAGDPPTVRKEGEGQCPPPGMETRRSTLKDR